MSAELAYKPGRYALRTTVGSLSAGTRVRVLEMGATWVDVTTEAPMQVALGGHGWNFAGSLNGRPIISGLRRDFLVALRPGGNDERKQP